MIAKLLPVLLLLAGAGAGIGAAVVLKPDPNEMLVNNPCGEMPNTAPDHEQETHDDSTTTEQEYVQLNNQFVVPVVDTDMVNSLVVLTLGIEVDPGHREEIYKREPKLRDALLQVLFDHANMGGFRGQFTDGNKMDVLRMSLAEAARSVIGGVVSGVLITDIARQDV